ncbi:MAG: aldose 1-epimerase family protein [Bacteriovorax sp.]|jgi:galactose mutarotase-like enzyme
MSDWYQIENSSFIVQTTSAGAEIKRMFAKSWHRELLWVPQDDNAKKIWNRSSPILFPIVGKLKDDIYKLKDKAYKMSQHGFARDKNFKCLVCGTSEIEFLLEADQETFKSYPFCFELRVKYLLEDNKLNITYSVKNTDRQEIYFSIGAHPAFHTINIEDYEILFEKSEKGYYQLDKDLVDWTHITALESNSIKPTQELFSKGALIFKNVKSKYIDLIDHKKHEGIRINGTNTPYLGIWAKDSIPFICIEPWFGVSDDADHDQNLKAKKGIRTLAMGKSFDFSYSLELMAT